MQTPPIHEQKAIAVANLQPVGDLRKLWLPVRAHLQPFCWLCMLCSRLVSMHLSCRQYSFPQGRDTKTLP